MSSVSIDTPDNHHNSVAAELDRCLQRQRKAYHADPNPDLAQRRQDLLALKSMLSENREAIIEAICKD